MKISKNKNRGIVQLIVVFIILIAILMYFNIDVEKLVQSKPFQWGLGLMKGLWQNFISPAIDFIFKYFENTKTIPTGDNATTTWLTTAYSHS